MYIRDMQEKPEERERIRREIHNNVEIRRQESHTALQYLISFSGIIYSGSVIAILGYIGSYASKDTMPNWVILALPFFIFSLMSFSFMLHWHAQLYAKRSNHFSQVAQKFFLNEASLQDVIECMGQLTSKWLFRLLFWIPFVSALLGFACIVAAILNLPELFSFNISHSGQVLSK